MHDLRARIIDANANRAREALRVMEDAARFGLDDEALCSAIKSLRHDLRAALESSGPDTTALLAWRDTPGDVGTNVSTAAEYTRSSLAEVVTAACKRLTEALRSIEECMKGYLGGGGARAVESIRYRAYEVEKRLLLALPAASAPQWRLCVLLTASLCTHMSWVQVAEECVAGGADCMQLREKDLSHAELLARAHTLVSLARQAVSNADRPRPAVIINDRPDIAVLAGADGVHVGQTDLPILEIRKLVGHSLLVGVSTGTLEEAQQAVRDGADYIGVGPMFETTTKHKPVIAGPAHLDRVLRDPVASRVPHLAIGGITPDNIGELRAVGCRGVAVSGFVQKEQRPAVACRALYDGIVSTH